MKQGLKRALALVLVLLMLPLFSAQAAEEGALVPLTCRDYFDPAAAKTVTLLERQDGYYITHADACSLAGVTYVGGQWLTAGGKLSLPADLSGIDTLQREGETWLRLEQILNRLKTVLIPSSQGALYVSLPVNQERLLTEVERILENGGYQADMLSDSFIGSVAVAFAFVYDVVWNMRFDAFTGKAYADDISELMLSVLKPVGSGSLQTMLEDSADWAEKGAAAMLDAQKIYEFVGDAAGFAVPNGEYLLYGIEGSGMLHESLRAVDALDDVGVKLSDVLSVTAHMYEVGRVESLYAGALERVLKADAVQDSDFFTIREEGRQILNLYNAHLEDNRASIVFNGGMMLAEDIVANLLNNTAEDLILGMAPGPALVKFLIDTADSCTIQTMKKNDCVRTLSMCAGIQSMFEAACREAMDGQVNGEAAMMMRDAMILYLKTAWTAYDSASFDDEIAGAILMVQGKLEEELILLNGFPDGMFCLQENEPFPVGIFSVNLPQDAPAGEGDACRELYMAFLEERAYIPAVSDGWLKTELEAGYGGGYFFIHDVDRDGCDDLLVWLGAAADTGEMLLFTGKTGTVELVASMPCTGDTPGIYGSDTCSGFAISEFDGEREWITMCDLVGGELIFYMGDASLSGDWYPMEPEGWLPLDTGTQEDAPAYEGGAEGIRETALNGRFSMTVPDRWADQYVIVDGVMAFTVYEKQNYEAGYGGELFTVYMSGYTDESQVGEFEEVLLNEDGWIIVVTFPLTVQWADGDEGLSMAYFMLQPDIREVLDSVRLEG